LFARGRGPDTLPTDRCHWPSIDTGHTQGRPELVCPLWLQLLLKCSRESNSVTDVVQVYDPITRFQEQVPCSLSSLGRNCDNMVSGKQRILHFHCPSQSAYIVSQYLLFAHIVIVISAYFEIINEEIARLPLNAINR